MKVLIIGASGQLGSDLAASFRAAGHEVSGPDRATLDITDSGSVRSFMASKAYEVVINCSVFHPVDDCETDPQRSFAVNALAVRDLALALRDSGCKLMHISSDYVFDGEQNRPYVETDQTNPKSVFGVSKVAGEQLLRNALQQHFIVRTSGLYGLRGSRVKKGNFVETMLRLGAERGEVKVVADLRMAQTFTGSLARQLLRLVTTEAYGTYHASDHGDYSWFEFAEQIFALSGMKVLVTPTRWDDVSKSTFAPRPAYSVLRNAHLQDRGLDCMVPIRDSLIEYLTLRQCASAAATH